MKRMRRVRTRLTFTLFILVISFSSLSILVTWLVRNGYLLDRGAMRYVIFGFAIKDLVLLLAALVIGVIGILALSKGTTNPIVTLNRATKEVASGNFDVQINLKESVEEYGTLQRNFNAMVRELKSNEYLRKDFISNVSHELKTPLSIISGYARLLEEGGLSEVEQQEYLRFIAEESERLQKLCADMLRLTKIDSQSLGIKRAPFALDEQLRRAILLLEPKWSEKALEFDLTLPPCSYTGDEELLLQVWQNLFDNAVKFSSPGGRIGVDLCVLPEALQVRVSDTGEGMDELTRTRMFEQFYQGDSSHKKEGSGLGLAIVKRIVDMHGGSIEAQGRPGAGSCFTVRLPL